MANFVCKSVQCFFYLVALINVIIHCDAQWNIENISSPSLPRGDGAQAVGFYNNTIYLLGGYVRDTALVKYIPSANIITDEGPNALPFICSGHSQHYVQINDKLYWIQGELNVWHGPLYSYHYPTKSFNTEAASVPGDKQNSYSCLTSYNNLLFVLGGFDGAHSSQVTVYNTVSNTWILSIDNMILSRRDFCCSTDAKRGVIYSIGGHNEPNGWMEYIETLAINNANISESLWSDSDPLMYADWGLRAIYIEADDSILVIHSKIQRIDCETGAVSFMADMNYEAKTAAIIYTDGVLYVFGGYINSQTAYDTWQRITNPLILVSSEPTISTTQLALSTQAFITNLPPTTEAMTLLDLLIILCCVLFVIVIISLIALLFYRKTHIVPSDPKAPRQNVDITPHKDNAVAHENHIEQNVVNNSDNDIFAKSQQIKSQQRERAMSSSSSSDSEDLYNNNNVRLQTECNTIETAAAAEGLKDIETKKVIQQSTIYPKEDDVYEDMYDDRLQTAGERVEKENECNVIETAGEGLEGANKVQKNMSTYYNANVTVSSTTKGLNQFKDAINTRKVMEGSAFCSTDQK